MARRGSELPQHDELGAGLRIDGYRLERVLADGGMGRVFAATEDRTGLRVAIKTLLSGDAVSREYFRQEIETLRTLKHPGIVRFHDHGVAGGWPFYAMDLLEGVTLRDALSTVWPQTTSEHSPASGRESLVPTSGERLRVDAHAEPVAVAAPVDAPPIQGPDSGERLLRVCSKLFEALEYVHGRGVVHGDIKPENVFLHADDQPVLVDFGVAVSFNVPRERLALVPRSIGSVAYMAPEQLRGALPDARADLYAMGCILYECLTGAHPFLRDSVEATTLAHLYMQVPPPSQRCSGIPRRLEALVMRLLAKSAADRCGYARDALDVLLADRTSSSELEEAPRSEYLFRSPPVGRTEPFEALRDRLDKASGAAGSAILLRATRGMGKTRLLLDLVDVALRAGMRVLHLECVAPAERAAEPPFGPLQALLRALSEDRAASWRDHRLAACRAALEVLSETREPAVATSRVASAKEDLLDGLCAELLDCSTEGPVLLAVDDVHHADEITREFLRRLATNDLGAKALLLVATDAGERTSAFDDAFQTLTLPPLNEADVESTIRCTLAIEHPSPSLCQQAYRVSRGNPQVLGHYLRALIGARVLRRDRHQGWHLNDAHGTLDAKGLEFHEVQSERALFERRVCELTPGDAYLARCAALLENTFDLQLLARVARRSEGELRASLLALCQREVLEAVDERRFRVAHPLLTEVLKQHGELSEAKRIHRRAAAVLMTARVEGNAAALAHHLARCGARAKAARWFARAATLYLQRYDRQDALQAIEAAVSELSSSAASRRRHAADLCGFYEQLGDVAMMLRHYAKAAQAYRDSLELTGDDPVHRARQYRKLAGALQRNDVQALDCLARASELLGQAPGDRAEHRTEWIQVALDTMWVHYWKQRTRELLAIAERIEPAVHEFGTPQQRASLSFSLAVGLLQKHRYVAGPAELEHIERAFSIYESLDDRANVAMCRFVRSMIRLFSGDLPGAEQGFESLLAFAEKATSVTIRVRALTFLCIAQRRLGARERVRKLAAAAHSLAKEHDMREYQGTAMANLSWVAFHDGESAECERLVRTAIEAWNQSPLNVFRWTGLLPLLATIASRPERETDGNELRDIAKSLLHESQQKLPDDVESALLRLREAETLESARAFAQQVFERACGHGLM